MITILSLPSLTTPTDTMSGWLTPYERETDVSLCLRSGWPAQTFILHGQSQHEGPVLLPDCTLVVRQKAPVVWGDYTIVTCGCMISLETFWLAAFSLNTMTVVMKTTFRLSLELHWVCDDVVCVSVRVCLYNSCSHYFVNGGWFPENNYLLDNVDKIRHLPATIVQGRYGYLKEWRSEDDMISRYKQCRKVSGLIYKYTLNMINTLFCPLFLLNYFYAGHIEVYSCWYSGGGAPLCIWRTRAKTHQ